MPNKNCIISFANQKNAYLKNLARLGESLKHNFDGEFLAFVGEETVGAPKHEQVPYAFKVYCIEKVWQTGLYKNILWLDTSCFAIKNVQPIFDEIEKDGMIFQDGGHFVNTWTNDFTLKYFGITREEASKMKTMGNAGFLGMDMVNPIAVEFFKRWEAAMKAGTFVGNWTNENKTESDSPEVLGHRHDLSSASIIIHQMGIFDV